MKHSVLALTLIGGVVARPTAPMNKREVPQEHAHENILKAVDTALQANNPAGIGASVFGLLGAAAGIAGAGDIADADCLQQATADQAFTNAKAAGDIDGMTSALIFRALERNTVKVGLASVPCTSIKAVNPEIAALQQHQDPAGTGAQALNKKIAAELARQISSIGGDPALANEASTFAPGDLTDATAAGNTCDDANDVAGCINTQGLRVDDLSKAEIAAAVAGAGQGASQGSAQANNTASANTGATGNGAKAGGKKSGANGNTAKGAQSAANGNAAKGAQAAANGNAAQGAQSATNGNAAQGAQSAANGNAAQGAQTATPAAASASGADFGSCTDPTVTFGPASDGRKEDAFEATDLTNFNHGSALNIAVISGFICSQLTNACKANAAAVTLCNSAASAASGLKAQAAADAFNTALGF